MGVYINMEMPKNCALCPMWDAGNCLTASETIICEYDKRPQDCPIVPVPPHGRLIDADALVRDNGIKEIPEYYEVVRDAPTIIPAEEGET